MPRRYRSREAKNRAMRAMHARERYGRHRRGRRTRRLEREARGSLDPRELRRPTTETGRARRAALEHLAGQHEENPDELNRGEMREDAKAVGRALRWRE